MCPVVSWRERIRTLGENLQMALEAIAVHRFRSFLTVLGVVIGITTIVTVASLLGGLREGIVVFFQELGPNNIFIMHFSGDPYYSRPPRKQRHRKPLEPWYAERLRQLCPSLEDAGANLLVTPVELGRNLVVRAGRYETTNIRLVGVDFRLQQHEPRDLADGRLFTYEEARRGDRVALLGANVAEALFPRGHAVGKTFWLDGAEYRVIGVFEPAKGGFLGENDLDNQINIPFKTARLRYPHLKRVMIVAIAKEGLRDQAYEEVEWALRRLRGLKPDEPNDFEMNTPDQIIEQFDELIGIIVSISLAISALGLLVGGIGVMNIMLVSVTERTREIGVRKAIGARSVDIILQFLLEAVALTGSGGLLGVGFSVLTVFMIGFLVPVLPAKVPAWAIVTGFGTSVLVGVLFGVWPAIKAARLDPVEALRYE